MFFLDEIFFILLGITLIFFLLHSYDIFIMSTRFGRMSNKEQAGSSNIYEIAWAGFVTELSPPKLLLLCLQKRAIIEPRELNGVCLLFCQVATKTK